MGSEGGNLLNRREQRRARVELIALYTEFTVAYKELVEAGQHEQAALLVSEIDRLRELLAESPPA